MAHCNRENEYFSISIVAEMFQLTPQTLRLYETHGLVVPKRTEGGNRAYSRDDLHRISTICHLTNDLGVNLAGVEVVLKMMDRYQEQEAALMERFRTVLERLHRRIEQLEGASAAPLVPLHMDFPDILGASLPEHRSEDRMP